MPAGAAPMIAVEGISKKFGRLLAVNNLSLNVFPGEVFGFLGLNGAGKTTTIRILLDLLRPDRGRTFVDGRDCRSEGLAVRAMVGYMPGEMSPYGDMTGLGFLDLMEGLAARHAGEQCREALLERFVLSRGELKRRLREYSTGMKRKLGLIQAFQSDPSVLILDEPTEGLDPLMQEAFYDLISEMRRRGRTVFMSSHVLSEIERVCSRVGVLRKGELVLDSTIEQLRQMAERRVRVVFDRDVQPLPDETSEGVRVLGTEPREWRFAVQGPLGGLLGRLSGLPVRDLVVSEPRLEDILLRYYRGTGS